MAGFQYLNRPDYIGNAFDGLIAQQQGHEQQNAAQNMLDQQQRGQQEQQQTAAQQQQLKFLLDQYFKQPAEVQTKLYATAPDTIKQYLIDPNLAYNTTQAQQDRELEQTIKRNKITTAQRFNPTGGDTSALNYDFMTGHNAPKEALELGYMRDYLSPQQIGTTMMAPAMKDIGAANASNAEAGLRNAQTPWVAPEAKARINLQGAQAGKAVAETTETKQKIDAARRATAANASYAGKAVGPNGHLIGSNDGVRWFDVATGEQVQMGQQVKP